MAKQYAFSSNTTERVSSSARPCKSRFCEFRAKRLSFRTVTAFTGTEAIKSFRTDQPHLIILDIALPEQNGLSVCAIAKMLGDDKMKMENDSMMKDKEKMKGMMKESMVRQMFTKPEMMKPAKK